VFVASRTVDGALTVVVTVVVVVVAGWPLLPPVVVVVVPVEGAVMVMVDVNALEVEPSDIVTVAVPAVTGVTVNWRARCEPAEIVTVSLVASPLSVATPES